MYSEKELKALVKRIASEVSNQEEGTPSPAPITEEELSDITEVDLRSTFSVPSPTNREGFLALKAHTPARIGVWRAGPRYRTETLLRFRADHAVAMDAVFNDVSEDLLSKMGLFTVSTLCRDRDEYLTRPDLGRRFGDRELAFIKEKCQSRPQVQIIIADGLSSLAIEANLSNILPAILKGLKGYGLEAGTPFFIQYGRVPIMDVVSEATGAEVTCLLVGERPGLATGESMSAYIAYKATVGMPEARRTVISNIHQGGTAALEAGAQIAHLLKKMVEFKKSGLDLKL